MTDLTPEQRIERATRASQASEEFLAPAFERMRKVFDDRLKAICNAEPWASEKIVAAAHVVRMVDLLEADIATIIDAGEVSAADKVRAEKYEQLSPAARRLLAIGPLA